MKILFLSLALFFGCGSSDGGATDGGAMDAGAGAQSACTGTVTQVSCTDDHGTALCAITPRSCSAAGIAYSPNDDGGSDPIWLVNGNDETCAALEAPLGGGGAAPAGAACSKSRDCALVCCSCAKAGWIFATGLCVEGHCAGPAPACAWGYADDPLVCGP